ncbi:MAG TPA: PAS domain S-box protein [Methylomirabilota bacterium]|nr:PAS domain S-box protein [Methylomirabilota bacterium]
MRVRWFLLAVVSVTLVPLALVAGLAIWLAHRDQREDLNQALLDHSRALAVAVDREIETSVAALEALGTSGDLESGDLRRFYEQARRARDAHRRWLTVALIDPAGRPLLNLLRPMGSALPSVSDSELFQRTARTLEPEVSNLFVGATSRRWTVAVNVPLLRDGKLRYVLSAVLTPDGFSSVLAAAQIPAGSVASIVDRRGILVASTRDQEGRVGRPVLSSEIALARDQNEAVFPGRTLEGEDAYTAVSRAPRSQFAVAITVPAAQLEAPLRRSLWLISATAIAGFAVALGLAFLAGRLVGRRMAGLSGVLTAFGRGETVPAPPRFRMVEFQHMADAVAAAMALLRTRTEALQESERRYRTTFERNPAGMCLTLEEGGIVDCNEACARILGAGSPGELAGASMLDFYVDPKDREQLRERVRTEGTAVNAEVQFRRRDGRLIWVLLNIVRAAAPARADYETTLIDITEHRAAEELRSIARLANTMAHEVNNPLTTIIGRLAMLRDDRGLGALAQERVAQALAAAERIRQLVADMHQLTRIERFEHTSSGLPEMIDIRRSAGPARPEQP